MEYLKIPDSLEQFIPLCTPTRRAVATKPFKVPRQFRANNCIESESSHCNKSTKLRRRQWKRDWRMTCSSNAEVLAPPIFPSRPCKMGRSAQTRSLDSMPDNQLKKCLEGDPIWPQDRCEKSWLVQSIVKQLAWADDTTRETNPNEKQGNEETLPARTITWKTMVKLDVPKHLVRPQFQWFSREPWRSISRSLHEKEVQKPFRKPSLEKQIWASEEQIKEVIGAWKTPSTDTPERRTAED